MEPVSGSPVTGQVRGKRSTKHSFMSPGVFVMFLKAAAKQGLSCLLEKGGAFPNGVCFMLTALSQLDPESNPHAKV